MAAVLDALAPYVKKLIKDMAEEEVSMLLGVSGEITKLDDNIESLKGFLSDAERKRITDPRVQKWVNKLKDAMYETTDIMELCQIEADERRELELEEGSGREQNHLLDCCQPLLMCLQDPIVSLITCGGIEKMQDFFQRFLFCLRNPVFAHEIGSRIKELNQRLEGIHREAHNYRFNISLASNPDPEPTVAKLSGYRTISHIDESAIVGEQIERDTKELVQVLRKDENHNIIKVVSIIGMGGMGKTTLAQKIFNEASIQEHFKTKIWLSITKQFDEAELLRTAIKHAGGSHGGEQDQSTLMDTLIGTLSAKGRFLLVMDDMWSLEAWNNVLNVPARNASKKQSGSRVLVTTRSADLPQQMQASLHQHRVRPLGRDDAWSLLKTQLQPDQVEGIDQLKTIGMEILENCDGLPLAIKVIGGLLSTRYPSEQEWKTVLNKPAWSLAGLPSELDKRLYLSYEDLSPNLKQCFLYCSMFPKDTKIIRAAVTRMWISEGFIQPPDGRSTTSSHEYELEDKANEYYRELIKRNLIEPAKGYSLPAYECIMHDVVRSFAEYMAREESMVMVSQDQATSTSGGGMLVCRLSVGQTVSLLEWAVLQRQESLRTLIIYSRLSFHPGDSLVSFSRLRVLCVWYADFDMLVPSISKLKHLRYLRLEDTNLSMLPDDIHKMKFLLFLSLRNCQKLCELPSSIIKLVHLRSLSIDGSNDGVIPKGFGALTNLRSLYGFPVHVDTDAGNTWCSLQELGSLSQLRVLRLCGLEKVHDSQMAEKAMISSKCHLWNLQLLYNASDHAVEPGSEAEQERHEQWSVIEEEVLEKFCPPTCIEDLTLEGGYAGRQLPNWMCAPSSAEFNSLRHLKLKNLPCCTQLPDGLCCLPSLESLEITDAPAIKRVTPQFQASSSSLPSGASSSITSAPFPKLRLLLLQGLREWEEWEWNDYEEQGDVKAVIAMPCLEGLHIKNCKLSCLPGGLASCKRLALRELNLYDLSNLKYVENFPSVVKLDVFDCPMLERISGLSSLQKVRIVRCRKVETMEGVPVLDSLEMWEPTMETVPEYVTALSPRFFKLTCSKRLYESLLLGSSSSEYDKISHIKSPTINYFRSR